MSDLEREFTTEEKQDITYKKLYSVRQNLANRFIMCNLYEAWSDDFKLNTLSSVFEEYKADINDMPFEIDITLLTTTQLLDLGFGKWSSDNGLMLVPLCLLPFIGSVELTDIFGEEKKSANRVNDFTTRFGCVPYGIVPKDFTPDENKGHSIPEDLRDN